MSLDDARAVLERLRAPRDSAGECLRLSAREEEALLLVLWHLEQPSEPTRELSS